MKGIRFQAVYSINELYNATALYIAYMSNRIVDNAGTTQEVNYAMTEEDKPLWNRFAKQNADTVYSLVRSSTLKDQPNFYKFGHKPIAVDDFTRVFTGGSVIVQLDKNDAIVGSPTEYNLVNLNGGAKHGAANIKNNGELTYTSINGYVGVDVVECAMVYDSYSYSSKVYVEVLPKPDNKQDLEIIERKVLEQFMNTIANTTTVKELDSMVVYKLYFKDSWDNMLADVLKSRMFEIIVRGCVYDWFFFKLRFDLAEQCKAEYNGLVKDLKATLNGFKTMSRSKHIII